MPLHNDLFPAFPAGAPTKVFGVIKVTLNGVDYLTKPGATLDVGGRRHTSQFGNEKRTGASWEPVSSVLSCEFIVYSETDFEAIRDFEGIAEYITDVGVHVAADNCIVVDPPAFSDAGGGIAITIEGDPAYAVAAGGAAGAASARAAAVGF